RSPGAPAPFVCAHICGCSPGAPPDRIGLSCTRNWDELLTTVRPGGFQQSDLDHAAVTIPTIKDPKGVVEQSPLTQGRSYEGQLGSRPVTFNAQ
ncbi:hypothetical protein ACFWA9_37520, partial [Kitasatospora sp. NPDC059973]|uniref:hypothetical protein n=1 Tax=Kitasatospora sp. NPDC059973 TaxID=3347020 RepID=UPI0036BA749E